MSDARRQVVAACCGKPISVPPIAEQDDARWCFACLETPTGDVKYTRRIAAQFAHIARNAETF